VPEETRLASQWELIEPGFRSNSTFQLEMLAPVPFVTVHFPSKPVVQSDVFTHDAVTEAADAELAMTTAPPVITINKAEPKAKVLPLRSLDIVLLWDEGRTPTNTPGGWGPRSDDGIGRTAGQPHAPEEEQPVARWNES
jgi:hypothetical protein